MPIFYVLLFLTGDTKGHMSWNVAEVAQSKAACEEIRKKNCERPSKRFRLNGLAFATSRAPNTRL